LVHAHAHMYMRTYIHKHPRMHSLTCTFPAPADYEDLMALLCNRFRTIIRSCLLPPITCLGSSTFSLAYYPFFPPLTCSTFALAGSDSRITIVGFWVTSTAVPDQGMQGATYYHNTNSGGSPLKQIRFDFDVPTPGSYNLSVTYRAFTNRANNVPYKVMTDKLLGEPLGCRLEHESSVASHHSCPTAVIPSTSPNPMFICMHAS